MRLSQEQLNILPAKDRERYTELEKLFASKGWKIVVKLAQENADLALKAAAFAESWENNRIAIGNRSTWLTIANWEALHQEWYEQTVDELSRSKRERAELIDEEDYE